MLLLLTSYINKSDAEKCHLYANESLPSDQCYQASPLRYTSACAAVPLFKICIETDWKGFLLRTTDLHLRWPVCFNDRVHRTSRGRIRRAEVFACSLSRETSETLGAETCYWSSRNLRWYIARGWTICREKRRLDKVKAQRGIQSLCADLGASLNYIS